MSEIIQGYEVFDVGTTTGYGLGYEARDYQAYPLGGLKSSRNYAGPRLTTAERLERIAEKTAKKTWITDHCDRVGSKVKNQQNSNYCWIHAPVRGMEIWYVLTGQFHPTLSAFYAGSRIKGGRNQGGSGIQGLEWLSEHGTCLESLWPSMKFSGTVSEEVAASAARHQVTSFVDMDPRDYEAIWDSIICDQPVTFGIPAMSHEMIGTKLIVEDGGILIVVDNSWGTGDGTNGRRILRGSTARFDEAGSIQAVEASAA